MRSYRLDIEHKTPMMQHRDNLAFNAIVQRWQRDPLNRDRSIPGDDRAPAWLWLGSLYTDGTNVTLPTDCLMAAAMGAGTEIKASRGRKTLKAQTQSGMAFAEPYLAFSVNGGRPITMASLQPLHENLDFDAHLDAVHALGFDLDVRRVRIGTSKVVRVRPLFDTWRASGVVRVWDDVLSAEVLQTVFSLAGDKYGLCEWRPSGRRPGPFGRFSASLTPIDS